MKVSEAYRQLQMMYRVYSPSVDPKDIDGSFQKYEKGK